MRLLFPLFSLACTPGVDDDVSTSLGGGETSGTTLPGPHVYGPVDTDGVALIDALFVLTPQAVAEIEDLGETPEGFLSYRIDDLNETLSRSLVESSVVRSLGVHALVDEDFDRTGVFPAGPSVTIDAVMGWLTSYRSSYGADKVLVISATEENDEGAALGGGDVSAYWVDFLPIEHEVGHCMGASHCNEGTDGVNYGMPVSGYDEAGFPVDGPIGGGTRMCGNNIAFFSNPDVRLTLDEIDGYVSEGLMPDEDWAAVVDVDGMLPMGDAQWANVAQMWRDNELSAAEGALTVKYPGDPGTYYEKDSCVGLYADPGYRSQYAEICAGDALSGDWDSEASSIKLGRDVHANLFTDPDFGAGSMCGGQLLRLGFSSPSLSAISEHHGLESFDNAVGSIRVYPPSDRESHFQFDGGFSFYGGSAMPRCSSIDGETLTLLPDLSYWAGTTAVYNTPVAVPFRVEFEYYSLHEGGDGYHADGFTFFFGDDASDYALVEPDRSTLGFLANGRGHAVEFNHWQNHIAIRDGNFEVVDQVGASPYTAGDWLSVVIEVEASEVTVWYDGSEVLSAPVSVDDGTGVGFGAGTGAYTAEHSVRQVHFTPL
jgi:hypothetical protein